MPQCLIDVPDPPVVARRARLPRTGSIIAALVAWTFVSTGLVAAINVAGGRPNTRAVVLMGTGVLALWIGIVGLASRLYRDGIGETVQRVPLGWQIKFVVFATLLALLEEAVTTTMTNLAPLFGVPVGRAYITASTNYLDVVCLHSVVVFVPMFVAWAWMLRRWAFHPNAVLLLFGCTGILAEFSIGGLTAFAMFGFWILVYGLMVYLPAYTVPADRGALPPQWWHYPIAVFLPFLFVIPVAGLVSALHPVKIHFPPIPPNS